MNRHVVAAGVEAVLAALRRTLPGRRPPADRADALHTVASWPLPTSTDVVLARHRPLWPLPAVSDAAR